MIKDKQGGFIKLIILILLLLAAITYYGVDIREPVSTLKAFLVEAIRWFVMLWTNYIDPAIRSILEAVKLG